MMEFEFEYELLKAGKGRFQVESVESSFSKKGNPMLILKIRIFDGEQHSTIVTEYLTKTMLYRGRALLRAGGMDIPHNSTKIKIKLLDFEGKQGGCEIGVEDATADFPPKNIIKTYLEPTQDTPPPPTEDLSSFLG